MKKAEYTKEQKELINLVDSMSFGYDEPMNMYIKLQRDTIEEVGLKAFGVYYFLQTIANQETDLLSIQTKTLADLLNTNTTEVSRIMATLEEKEYIATLVKGNRYQESIYSILNLRKEADKYETDLDDEIEGIEEEYIDIYNPENEVEL